jgi:hypothetical protein
MPAMLLGRADEVIDRLAPARYADVSENVCSWGKARVGGARPERP